MKDTPLLRFLCATAVFWAVAPLAFGQEQAPAKSKVAPPAASTAATPATDANETAAPAARMHPLFVDILASRGLKARRTTAPADASRR